MYQFFLMSVSVLHVLTLNVLILFISSTRVSPPFTPFFFFFFLRKS